MNQHEHDKEFWDSWLIYNKDVIIYNDDGSINVDAEVYIAKCNLSEILVKFNHVSGDFNCQYNNLRSLKNCPIKIDKDLYCYGNNILSLEYCPSIVGGFMYYQFDIDEISSFIAIRQDGIDLIHKLNKGLDCKEFIFGLGSNDRDIIKLCQWYLDKSKNKD